MVAWRGSGLGAAEYAAQRGYSPGTLRRWAREVEELARGEEPSFVRLEVRASHPTPPLVVEVGAARIAVGPGFDPAHLRAVVAALGGGVS